jgi:DNA helicase-2/ATP-dependent DNA helicase PcrA
MFGQPAPERFASFLRRELDQRGVGVFNPRGQSLADQPAIRTLLGLFLECVDQSDPAHPAGVLTPEVLGLTNAARNTLLEWRQAAHAFSASNPAPGGLAAFVDAWAGARLRPGANWPDDWPVLELLFKLIAWMPAFQHDPEHQVWLEALSRACAQTRLFSAYGGALLKEQPHADRSRNSVIRDILRPIAEGLVDVDEELISSIPRDRLPIMTIHQSKGLEFPLVIVDVSANFKTNHRTTAGMRYPSSASSVTVMEDDLAPFTAIGAARTQRTALDRSFDDLMRLYYVAYSRAQTALLLVGNEKSIATASTVKTLSCGWRRDGTWSWNEPGHGRPTIANALPLVLL